MKKQYLKQFILLGLLLLTQQTIAQIPAIDSLKIIPANPTADDEIKVICYTTFPSGDCELSTYSLTNQNNTITLNLNFTVGVATYICHSIDTLSLGYLNADDYNLEVNLTIDPEETIVDHKIMAFSVHESVGIKTIIDDSHFSIYPNPFQNELSIGTDAMIEQLDIFSIFGKKVLSKNIIPSDKKINVSDLENGIYLIILTDAEGNQYSKKVLKTKL